MKNEINFKQNNVEMQQSRRKWVAHTLIDAVMLIDRTEVQSYIFIAVFEGMCAQLLELNVVSSFYE